MARAHAAKTTALLAGIRNAERPLGSATWEMALSTSTPPAQPTASAPPSAAIREQTPATPPPTLLSVWSTRTPLLPPRRVAPLQAALSQ